MPPACKHPQGVLQRLGRGSAWGGGHPGEAETFLTTGSGFLVVLHGVSSQGHEGEFWMRLIHEVLQAWRHHLINGAHFWQNAKRLAAHAIASHLGVLRRLQDGPARWAEDTAGASPQQPSRLSIAGAPARLGCLQEPNRHVDGHHGRGRLQAEDRLKGGTESHVQRLGGRRVRRFYEHDDPAGTTPINASNPWRPASERYLRHFEQAGRALAAANAHGDDDVFGTTTLAFEQRVANQAGAAHAVRMPNRDGAAIDIEDFHGDAQAVAAVDSLHGKSLVELPQVDVVHLQPFTLQQAWHGKDRANAHLIRLAARHRQTAVDAQRLQAFFSASLASITTTAAAPSDNWLALPAVMKPPSCTGLRMPALPGWYQDGCIRRG